MHPPAHEGTLSVEENASKCAGHDICVAAWSLIVAFMQVRARRLRWLSLSRRTEDFTAGARLGQQRPQPGIGLSPDDLEGVGEQGRLADTSGADWLEGMCAWVKRMEQVRMGTCAWKQPYDSVPS
eukprot:2209738-Pleurochrysis_carterae.AAC.1